MTDSLKEDNVRLVSMPNTQVAQAQWAHPLNCEIESLFIFV